MQVEKRLSKKEESNYEKVKKINEFVLKHISAYPDGYLKNEIEMNVGQLDGWAIELKNVKNNFERRQILNEIENRLSKLSSQLMDFEINNGVPLEKSIFKESFNSYFENCLASVRKERENTPIDLKGLLPRQNEYEYLALALRGGEVGTAARMHLLYESFKEWPYSLPQELAKGDDSAIALAIGLRTYILQKEKELSNIKNLRMLQTLYEHFAPHFVIFDAMVNQGGITEMQMLTAPCPSLKNVNEKRVTEDDEKEVIKARIVHLENMGVTEAYAALQAPLRIETAPGQSTSVKITLPQSDENLELAASIKRKYDETFSKLYGEKVGQIDKAGIINLVPLGLGLASREHLIEGIIEAVPVIGTIYDVSIGLAHLAIGAAKEIFPNSRGSDDFYLGLSYLFSGVVGFLSDLGTMKIISMKKGGGRLFIRKIINEETEATRVELRRMINNGVLLDDAAKMRLFGETVERINARVREIPLRGELMDERKLKPFWEREIDKSMRNLELPEGTAVPPLPPIRAVQPTVSPLQPRILENRTKARQLAEKYLEWIKGHSPEWLKKAGKGSLDAIENVYSGILRGAYGDYKDYIIDIFKTFDDEFFRKGTVAKAKLIALKPFTDAGIVLPAAVRSLLLDEVEEYFMYKRREVELANKAAEQAEKNKEKTEQTLSGEAYIQEKPGGTQQQTVQQRPSSPMGTTSGQAENQQQVDPQQNTKVQAISKWLEDGEMKLLNGLNQRIKEEDEDAKMIRIVWNMMRKNSYQSERNLLVEKLSNIKLPSDYDAQDFIIGFTKQVQTRVYEAKNEYEKEKGLKVTKDNWEEHYQEIYRRTINMIIKNDIDSILTK